MALNMKKVLVNGLLFTIVGCGLVACDKPKSPAGDTAKKQATASPAAPRAAGDLIASIHWVGKQRLAADTNAAAFLTIIIKEALYRYSFKVGNRLGSPAILAVAKDHRKDAITSVSTLVGVTGAFFGVAVLDPLAAGITSIFIFHIGYETFMGAAHDLMDGKPADVEGKGRWSVTKQLGDGLSVGPNATDSGATLMVHGKLGASSLEVREGDAQAGRPLVAWHDKEGTPLGGVDARGGLFTEFHRQQELLLELERE